MPDTFEVQDPVAVEFVAVSGVPVVTTAYGVVAGPPGPPGGSLTGRAGAAVGGHRAVAWDATGRLVYASSGDVSQVGAYVGVTTGAAVEGDTVTVVTSGLMRESSWSWTPDAPVWLGVDGALTQTAPTTGWVQKIGWAVTATSLYVAPGDPVVLDT